MKWLVIRISYCSVFVGLTLSSTSVLAESRTELFRKLPPANKRILSQLARRTGLTYEWSVPSKSQGKKGGTAFKSRENRSLGLVTAFTDKRDRVALLKLGEITGEISPSTGKWRRYWYEIPWSKSTFPTQKLNTGGQLLRLPDPSLPSGKSKFSDKSAFPLPGDVVMFNDPIGDRAAWIWWGNRGFPHWKAKSVSFFYFNYEYFHSSGVAFNSYPMRFTPDLFTEVISTEEKKLLPNPKLFVKANGYLSAGREYAYAKFYVPIANWPKSAPGFKILRRKPRLGEKVVELYYELPEAEKRPGGWRCYHEVHKRVNKAVVELGGEPLPAYGSGVSTVFARLWESKLDKTIWLDKKKTPQKYLAMGPAGAMAYHGMGTLVSKDSIWAGKLETGAVLQVWWTEGDFKAVQAGNRKVNGRDVWGHAFIFLRYVKNNKGEIIGMKIADQGHTGYTEPETVKKDDFGYMIAANIYCKQ